MKHTTRALAVFLLALAMVIGLLPGMGMTAKADGPISYMEWDGEKLAEKTGDDACKAYEVVTAATASFADNKWYVVRETLTNGNRIKVNGTAHLILMDGATLTASKGFSVQTDAHLVIHSQSGKTGALVANGERNYAAIGGDDSANPHEENPNAGDITIHGATVTATSTDSGAAIGGGNGGKAGTVTINDATVTAQGGTNYGAGIGGGSGGERGVAVTLIVNGENANITATGAGYSAGIGGAANNGGNITINNGTVNATGGTCGAGIGGNNSDDGGTLTVNGGTVTATGGDNGAGIGGGRNGSGANVTITGGTVTAKGGENAMGIGGGENGTNGTLNVGTGMYVYGKDNGQPNPPSNNIKKKNNDYERKRFMIVNNTEPEHYHSLVIDGYARNIKFTKWTDEMAKEQYGANATAATCLPAGNGSWYLAEDVTLRNCA